MTGERFEELMVKVVDGTATPVEREELGELLAERPELARELEAHRALKAVTDGWAARVEAELRMGGPPPPAWKRGLVAAGLALLLGGLALLLGWSVVASWLDPEVPLVVRVGLSALFGGGGLLLAVLFVERLRAARRDPYREVNQ